MPTNNYKMLEASAMTRYSTALRSCAIVFLSSMLFACGGGGGGGGGGGDNAAPVGGGGNLPPEVANAYLPTDSSVKWIYNGNTSLSYLAPAAINNVQTHSLVYPTGGKEYFTTGAQQIGLQGLYIPSITVGDGVTYTGDIKFNQTAVIFHENWTQHSHQSVGATGTIEIAPTYGKRSITATGTSVYEGDVVIATSLGDFLARKIVVDLRLSVTVEGVTFEIPYAVTFYLAKGMGIVRREQGGTIYVLSGVSGPDRDGDGMPDALDMYPDNPLENRDTDGDGIGDNADGDSDNDGFDDSLDKFPFDKTEWADADNDGIGDVLDPDDDNDGLYDQYDPYPQNGARQWQMTTGGETYVRLAAGYAGTPATASHDVLISAGNDDLHWSATSSASWLQISPVSQGWAGRIVADATGLAPGGYDAEIVIHDDDTQEQITVAVHFDVEKVRMYGSMQSIALASLPTNSKLTQTITVKNSRALEQIAWTASSDQSWLSVTPSGIGDAYLTFTANPAVLATDTTHYATVSLGSADPSVGTAQSIRVAFWVGSGAPAASAEVVAPYREVAADPLRPVIYTHNGGSDVDIYNIYTHVLLGTISGVAAQAGPMQVSADGTYLFVRDKLAGTVLRIELDHVQNRAALNIDGAAFTELRSNGYSLLMSSTGHVFDAADGLQLRTIAGWLAFPLNANFRAVASNDGNIGLLEEAPVARNRISYSATYSGQGSDGFVYFNFEGNDYHDYARDIAMAPSGNFGYVAGRSSISLGSGPKLYAFGWFPIDLNTTADPTNVEIGFDDTIAGSAGTTLWIYNNDRTLRLSSSVNGSDILERQLTISADGKIVAALNNDRITFIRAY